jgi:hypothetical protein
VHPDVAADQHRVARRGAVRCDVDAVGDDPDARGVHVHPVAAAVVHHLGVAGHQPDPGGRRGGAHRRGDPAEVGHRGALLQDERRRQVQRRRARHGQVVDRAVDRQIADRAAREEHRLDHERVGGERDPGVPGRHDRAVTQFVPTGFGGGAGRAVPRQEQVLDQLAGHRAAAAVSHHDGRGVAQRDRAGPVLEVQPGGHEICTRSSRRYA